MYSSTFIQQIDLRQSTGRVFAVGDIHGQYDDLMRLLERQGFSDADHLLLVGDLVDRGKGSFDAINFVFETANVHSVMGNHEEMMADAYFPLLEKARGVGDIRMMERASLYLSEYLANYGHWMYSLSQEDWGDFHAIMRSLDQLPYVLDVALPGDYRVGVCHAHYPERSFGVITETQIKADPRLTQRLIWERSLSSLVQRWAEVSGVRAGDIVTAPASLVDHHGECRVANVDLLLHGHTVMPTPILAGNHLFIDTGGCFPGGHLSLIEITPQVLAAGRSAS